MVLQVRVYENSPYGDYKVGECGFITGYCRGGDDVPCAVVCIKKSDGKRLIMIPMYQLKVVNIMKDDMFVNTINHII